MPLKVTFDLRCEKMDYRKFSRVLKNAKQVYREDYVKKLFKSAHYDIGLFEEQLCDFNSSLTYGENRKAKEYMDRTIIAQVLDDASLLLEVISNNPKIPAEQNQEIEAIIDRLEEMRDEIEVLEEVKMMAQIQDKEENQEHERGHRKMYANV
ncbi:hypothetical protein Metho_0468 [Methanomethylovorans hollandica DSM 15978]|uniref:Uncharacterized protein n=2 Tax=Methanomethylovorans hollandica TaxID=101192 RepID=L0KVM0_METHD|nr:hypothetical protein Metho_0468 [Methanomethylovorans hollandica DSM 15978]